MCDWQCLPASPLGLYGRVWHARCMRIIVCVKHVPDPQSERRFEDGHLVRGEDDVLNELDENAIEAAVELVEEHGGEAIAVTMGPEDAEDAIMRALQMGADRGVLLSDERLERADAGLTALGLAGVIEKLAEEAPVDLVITGMASLDAMTSLLPAALATRLNLPLLGLARSIVLDPENRCVEVERNVDGYDDVLRSPLPALVSVTDQINEPRYPAFAQMRAAHKKPLDSWSLDEIADTASGSLIEARPRVLEVIESVEKERSGPGQIITDSGEGGKRLAEYLREVVK